MKRALLFVAIAGVFRLAVFADAPPPMHTPTPAATPRPTAIHVILAREADERPMNKFSTDASKIRAIWNGSGLHAGDQIHAIWIADDVGAAAPKHTPITDASVTAYKPDDDGVFSLGRPKEGWPAGKYRFEIYVNKRLANAVNFIVQGGVTVEISSNQTPAASTSAEPTPTESTPIETSAPLQLQTREPLQLEPSPAVQPKQ